jgi:ribosomal protein S1
MHDFMDEIEKTMILPRNGEIVTGEVIQVSNREIVVNLDAKKTVSFPRKSLYWKETRS